MQKAPSQFMRYADAAEKLCVSVRTVRRMVTRNELEITQAPGVTGTTGVRVTRRSVQRLVDRQMRIAAWDPGELPPLNI